VAALIQALTTVPTISSQPASRTVVPGRNVTLIVGASSGTSLTYQWLFNGAAISGATGASLALTNVSSESAGNYSVAITNSAGTTTSTSATLAVSANATSTDARLYAISCRAQVGTGGDVLIPGIIVGGSGSRQIIVRAGGPAIQGVSGTLAKPQLKLYRAGDSAPIATNTGWSSGSPAEISALQNAFTAANLPSYPVGSADCALLATVTAGNAYTAVISGVNDSTGVAWWRFMNSVAVDARITALSCRAQVGNGGSILIPGAIVLGATSKQVIVRAKGPASKAWLVCSARPTLAIFDGAGVKIAENTGWSTGDVAAITAASAVTGLEPLAPGSADCAVLATLSPGGYTAQVSGVNGMSGVALIEIYEVP